jgi:putative transposase
MKTEIRKPAAGKTLYAADSRHADPIAPNRLDAAQVNGPDQAWVTDATGILTGEGWLYLVALLDVHPRRIVVRAMIAHLDAEMAVRAVQMAIQWRRPPPELIVHSDRGRWADGVRP